jgi:hypothetical protein
MRLWFTVLSLLIGAISSAQQNNPIRVPALAPNDLASFAKNLENTPPDMTLIPHGEGARHGKVWARNLGYALLVWGVVDGPPPDFPKNKNTILANDHVEVWLAAATDVSMPVVGWGNQFNQIELPKGEDSCPDWLKSDVIGSGSGVRETRERKCRAWAATQLRYRAQFKRLFVRQWQLTDHYSIESFAAPAYEQIVNNFASDQPAFNTKEEVPGILKPQQHGRRQINIGPQIGHPGYMFQLQIPYTDFPPLPSLELRDLRLMVDVFSRAPSGKKVGPFSTTSPTRVWGQPSTFNHVQLDPPRVFQMTWCDTGLTGTDKYGDDHPAWFIPQVYQPSEVETNAFILVNDARGYAYDPDGLSPVVRSIHHFSHNLSPGEWICGPELIYKNGTTFKRFAETVGEEGLDTKRLPDGTILIKSGPRVYYSEFGSGTCGVCPRVDLRVFALDKNLNLTKAFGFENILDNSDGQSMDFAISPDWSTLTKFDQAAMGDKSEFGEWSSTLWCLRGAKYEACGEKQNVQPPDPPLLKELRNPD